MRIVVHTQYEFEDPEFLNSYLNRREWPPECREAIEKLRAGKKEASFTTEHHNFKATTTYIIFKDELSLESESPLKV